MMVIINNLSVDDEMFEPLKNKDDVVLVLVNNILCNLLPLMFINEEVNHQSSTEKLSEISPAPSFFILLNTYYFQELGP